jgi:hypothetical protein
VTAVPGISGSLFPSRYIEAGLERDLGISLKMDGFDAYRQRCLHWWRRLEAQCGPATGLRAIVDIAAMPLAALLGFRARRVSFDRDCAFAQLETPGRAGVGLIVLPWAARMPERWRDATAAARQAGAAWCLVVAPPFLVVAETRGWAVRRSIDFRLPDAFDSRSFARFWSLAHADAFEGPRQSRLDALVLQARGFQDRVRQDLQQGVVQALHALSSVLSAAASPADPFDEGLTIVYRILFLLFAEAHDLVPAHHPVFGGAYTVGALCREALAGGRAAMGLWEGLAAITRLSRSGARHDDLIVRPFNGRLFARSSAPSLERRPRGRPARRADTSKDSALARTLIALATRPGRSAREAISYADLGVEQLGAVYERVLDLESVGGRVFRPGQAAHSLRRKQSGTFYTPQPLAEFVVRRTLAPLVAGRSTDEILQLRVLDPAMGSGAFLVAACRYLAGAYERALLDEGGIGVPDLTEDARAGIRRRIAERCLAGVDVNPVAVQLARLSLWLTSLASGKPLGFLDHRLRVGNSLIGTTPEDLWRQRPRKACRSTARSGLRTSGIRSAPGAGSPPFMATLFDDVDLETTLRQVVRPLGDLLLRRDDTVDVVRAKETIWSRLSGPRSPLEPWRRACDLWCAQWFWPEAPPSAGEVRAAIDALLRQDRTLDAGRLAARLAVSRDLAGRLGFFHWPLEFADVFYEADGTPRVRPGFDAVIGNPPWEMLRAEPRNPGTSEPRNPGTSEPRNQLMRFLRESSFYPNCDRGHVNLYQPFLERALSLTRPGGRVGLVLPWGLATDDGAASLRRLLFDRMSVDTVAGLENGAGLFPIHRGLRFMTLVSDRVDATRSVATRRSREVRMRCGIRTAAEIEALPDVDAAGDESAFPVRLARDTIAAVGGSTLRIPDLRSAADLDWLLRVTRTCPQLGAPDGWALSFGRELNASDDRRHFGKTGLPVLEGKHISPFRVNESGASQFIPPEVARRLRVGRSFDQPRLAYRDVSGTTNQRTLIAAILPAGVVTTHTLFCLRTSVPLIQQHFLCGLFNSYVLNAIVRLLMGTHVTTSLVEALPVPRWRGTAMELYIARAAERLSSRQKDPVGDDGAPQAAVARLYDLDRLTFSRILESFPLVPAEDRELALQRLTHYPREA